VIEGNAQDNFIDGLAGADILIGRGGNDTYLIDNAGDQVIESAGEGHDVEYSNVTHTIEANVEDLYLFGNANINATGNGAANTIVGNTGNNVIDGAGGGDFLTGGGGNDTFLFHVGTANNTTITDFNGNGAGAGDLLTFSGFGPGATFTNIDAAHWQVNYAGGTLHETITFSNAAAVHPTDVLFT
jgi:Ca2+-binding RTX toxin-like protein